jgi:hypothetical protein
MFSFRTAFFIMMVAFCASDARAQVDNRLAVGMSVSGSADVSFEMRIGHEHNAWGWQTSLFNWFDTDVREPIGGQVSDLGAIRIRPIMVGYGYTRIRGRAAFTVDVVGGYSFNSFHLDPIASSDYQQRLGASVIRSQVSNTFALKPEVQVWYDLTNRFGLKLNAGYQIARPSVTITSTLGEETRPIRADTFLITFGFVFSLL